MSRTKTGSASLKAGGRDIRTRGAGVLVDDKPCLSWHGLGRSSVRWRFRLARSLVLASLERNAKTKALRDELSQTGTASNDGCTEKPSNFRRHSTRVLFQQNAFFFLAASDRCSRVDATWTLKFTFFSKKKSSLSPDKRYPRDLADALLQSFNTE